METTVTHVTLNQFGGHVQLLTIISRSILFLFFIFKQVVRFLRGI